VLPEKKHFVSASLFLEILRLLFEEDFGQKSNRFSVPVERNNALNSPVLDLYYNELLALLEKGDLLRLEERS
jgi:hypothetical protein